jgi:hypothetical protein
MTLAPAAQEAIKQLMSVPSLRIAGSHDFKRATPLFVLLTAHCIFAGASGDRPSGPQM